MTTAEIHRVAQDIEWADTELRAAENDAQEYRARGSDDPSTTACLSRAIQRADRARTRRDWLKRVYADEVVTA